MEKPAKETIKILFLFLDINLTFVILAEYAEFFPKTVEAVIIGVGLLPFIMVALLQFLFVPQIALVVLSILFTIHLIQDRKNGNFQKRDLIHFIILLLWGLAGMYPSWNALQALLNM